jgi:nuclear cap-binding protein subunit 1
MIGLIDVLWYSAVEQPLKIQHLATMILLLNVDQPTFIPEILERIGKVGQEYLAKGNWRELKLILRLLAGLQGLFEGDGVFPLLDQLFEKAAELQQATADDVLGLEIAKVILFTIPYIVASSAQSEQTEKQATLLLESTDILASTPHPLEALVDPYPGVDTPREVISVIGLLQKQLQSESETGWKLVCLPRLWKNIPEYSEKLAAGPKYAFPAEIVIPQTLNNGPTHLFPEVWFSVYEDQDIETIPPTTNVASSLLRDNLVDSMNILDFNRNVVAAQLIGVDQFFTEGTFVKRATPFDRLKDVPEGNSTWKPEDVIVDAVFSQLFKLPIPEHKLVYYHSVLTEACKIAPAAVAPSLGRGIRYLYRNLEAGDLELTHRFMDWFAHHLSNFGFTWKWTEWVDDVELSDIHMKKSFINGGIEKEIRLSFAQRIRGTLPVEYQPLLPETKDKDQPDFKFNDESKFILACEALHMLTARQLPHSLPKAKRF